MENCAWSNDPKTIKPTPGALFREMYSCTNKKCPLDKLAVTKALVPETVFDLSTRKINPKNCADYPNYAGMTPEYPLCCNPPYKFNKKWPVQPSYLWSDHHDGNDDDVAWQWANNFGNNHHDIKSDNLEDNPGADPYGFIMLNGPPGSINNAFGDDFTVVSQQEPVAVRSRSLITSNRTLLDSVFNHAEETVQVYCNHPADSPACRRIFYKGAADTIIRLPRHVGQGPWARIISMEKNHSPDLPFWIIRKRDVTENQNGIYTLKFDYNFHLIQRADEPVLIRIDYTNIQEYWKKITNSPPAKRRRRSNESGSVFEEEEEPELVPHISFNQWKRRLDDAKAANKGSDAASIKRKGKVDFSPARPEPGSQQLDKRWYGPFGEWLRRLNNVKNRDGGRLSM